MTVAGVKRAIIRVRLMGDSHSVILYVCLCVCPQHNSKDESRSLQTLTLEYPTNDMVLRSKGQRSRSWGLVVTLTCYGAL